MSALVSNCLCLTEPSYLTDNVYSQCQRQFVARLGSCTHYNLRILHSQLSRYRSSSFTASGLVTWNCLRSVTITDVFLCRELFLLTTAEISFYTSHSPTSTCLVISSTSAFTLHSRAATHKSCKQSTKTVCQASRKHGRLKRKRYMVRTAQPATYNGS